MKRENIKNEIKMKCKMKQFYVSNMKILIHKDRKKVII